MITKFKLFEQKNDEWKLILDISKIWKDSLYENVNELVSFNDNYVNFLNNQKDLIIKKTSQNAWLKMQELIDRLVKNKNKIDESISVWDDIYDWADSNMIEIKTGSEIQSDIPSDIKSEKSTENNTDF